VSPLPLSANGARVEPLRLWLVVHHAITRHLFGQTGFKADEADSGAVTLIQRFGSAANLNIHLHCLVLDGVYRRTDGGPVFVQADSPTDEELRALLHKIISRLMKLLTRRGVLVEAQEGGSCNLADADADSDGARALRPLQTAALVPRPWLHFIRFHGMLAPNAKLRDTVVPHGPEDATGKSDLTAIEPGAYGQPCAH